MGAQPAEAAQAPDSQPKGDSEQQMDKQTETQWAAHPPRSFFQAACVLGCSPPSPRGPSCLSRLPRARFPRLLLTRVSQTLSSSLSLPLPGGRGWQRPSGREPGPSASQGRTSPDTLQGWGHRGRSSCPGTGRERGDGSGSLTDVRSRETFQAEERRHGMGKGEAFSGDRPGCCLRGRWGEGRRAGAWAAGRRDLDSSHRLPGREESCASLEGAESLAAVEMETGWEEAGAMDRGAVWETREMLWSKRSKAGPRCLSQRTPRTRRAPSQPALRSPGPPPPRPLPTGQQLRGRKVWAVGQLQRRSGWWVWAWVCNEGAEEPGAGGSSPGREALLWAEG